MSWFSNIASGITGALSGIPIVGDIAGAVGGAISGIEAERQHAKDQRWQANQAQLDRDFQREERIASQEYNEKMWHMNNEYNSLSNQVKLAQAAGLNPGALFGGSSGGFVSASPVTTKASPGAMASSPGSIASAMLTSDAQRALMLEQMQGQNIQNEFAPSFNKTALAKANHEINELASRAGLNDAQAQQVRDMLPLLKGKTRAEILTMKEQWKVLKAQIKSYEADANLKDNQAINEGNRTAITAFERQFTELFGVSPNAGTTQAIIQLIGSGDKGAKIAEAMLDTLFNAVLGAITTIGDWDRGTKDGKTLGEWFLQQVIN